MATVSLTANVQVGLSLPGSSGWLAILVAGLISVMAAWCFAELVGLFPSAAGIKLFIEKAFGERAALICATLYVGITVLIVGSEAYILASVLAFALPGVPKGLWVLAFLTLMAFVNIRGISLSGRAQDWSTYLMVVAIGALSLWALLKPGAPVVPDPLQLGSGLNLAQAVALGVFLYLGFEWVTPLAEEVTDIRLIPKGMLIGLGLLALTYGLLHVGMATWVPKAELAGSPIPHILFGQAAFGRAGVLLVALVSALASITSFNAGLMTASRFLYAMARDAAAPRVLARLHADWATPWVSILALYGLSAAMAIYVLWSGSYKLFIFLGAAIECMIFVMMAASVIRLRRTMPQAAREFRVPGGQLLPWVVVVLYGLLFVLVFIPNPDQQADIPAQLGALGALLGSALLVSGYVLWGVPKLRARLAAAEGTRRRRRPGAS